MDKNWNDDDATTTISEKNDLDLPEPNNTVICQDCATNGVFLTTMPICWQLDAKNFNCLTPRMVRHGLYDTLMESSFPEFFTI